MLKDFNNLSKALIIYKNRKKKYLSTKFTENQIKNLDSIRLRVRDEYRLVRKDIIKYGGDLSVKVKGMKDRWPNVFDYSLNSMNMNPDRFIALDHAIEVVNRAIQEVEAISIIDISWQDIKVTQTKSKEIV